MPSALVPELSIEDITANNEDLANTVDDTKNVLTVRDERQDSRDITTPLAWPRRQHQEWIKKNGNWIDEDLHQALAALNKGMNIHKASNLRRFTYLTLLSKSGAMDREHLGRGTVEVC